MGQLYQRRREVVEAVQWAPGVRLPGVEYRHRLVRGRRRKMEEVRQPTIETVASTRSVYPPGMFELAYEPV